MNEKSLLDQIKSALKIGVFGSDSDHCSENAFKIGYSVGYEIAKKGHIVYTGGGLGVMEAASKGASDAGGISIGVLPGNNKNEANEYCTIVIPTGIGFSRAQVITNSVDAAIIVGGGIGTLEEMLLANYREIPIVVIKNSGGVADEYKGRVLDNSRNKPSVYTAENAKNALIIIETEFNFGITDVNQMLEVSKAHAAPYTTKVFDKTFWVHPKVLSPKYSGSAKYLIENWDISQGHSVLDMGTGCGVLAIFSAYAGANNVVALDSNLHAVRNAKRNVVHHNFKDKIIIVHGDLYENINGTFDRILFNLPYWDKKPNSDLEKAFFDENYQTLTNFLKNSRQYLNKYGKVLLAFSDQGDVNLLENLIRDYGFNIEQKISRKEMHTRIVYHLR